MNVGIAELLGALGAGSKALEDKSFEEHVGMLLAAAGYPACMRLGGETRLYNTGELDEETEENFHKAVRALTDIYLKEIQALAKHHFGPQVLTVEEVQCVVNAMRKAGREAIKTN